jgi:hypothetical protein
MFICAGLILQTRRYFLLLSIFSDPTKAQSEMIVKQQKNIAEGLDKAQIHFAHVC